jgi:hypothetical protein
MDYLDKTLSQFWNLNTDDEFYEFDIKFKNTLKKILLHLGNYNYDFSKTYIDKILDIIKTFLEISENNFNKAISLSTSLHSNPPSLDIHLKRKKLCRKFHEYIIEMTNTIERNYSIFSNIPHDLENNILSYLPNNDLDKLSKMNLYLKNQVISIKSKRKVIQLPLSINISLGRAMSFNLQNRVRTRNRQIKHIFRIYPIIMDMLYEFGIREISPGVESDIFLSLFDGIEINRLDNRRRRIYNQRHIIPNFLRNQISILVREFVNIVENWHQDFYPMNLNINIDILQNNRRMGRMRRMGRRTRPRF